MTFVKRGFIFASVLSLFPLALIPPAYSQPKVLVVATGTPADPQLSGVLERAALLAVCDEGLAGTIRLESAATPPPLESGAVRPTSPIVADAKAAGAPLLVALRYEEDGGELTMELHLVEVSRASTLSSRTASLPLNLDLDSRVTSEARELLAAPEAAAALARVRKVAVSPAAANPSATVKASETAPASISPSAPYPSAKGVPAWALCINGGAAPILLVGDGSSYFRYGVDASLFGGARYEDRGTTIHGGLRIGAERIFPVSGLHQGEVYAILAGPEAGIGTSSGAFLSAGLRGSGGAAIITLKLPGSTLDAKTVPYLNAGVSMYLHPTKRLAVGVDAAFLAIFEGGYPILAVVPSLVVGTGL